MFAFGGLSLGCIRFRVKGDAEVPLKETTGLCKAVGNMQGLLGFRAGV